MDPLHKRRSRFSSFLFFIFTVSLIVRTSTAFSFAMNFSAMGSDAPDMIDFEGDAFFNKVVRLTKDELDSSISSSVGRAVYTDLIRLYSKTTGKLADFTTHFTFIIKATDSSDPGDGLAFFLSPPPSSLPNNSAGGYLALFNSTTGQDSSSNQIIAVEFDTYKNKWDPSSDHIGIDVNSIESVVTKDWDTSMRDGNKGNAWINYDGKSKILSVYLTYDDNPTYNGESLLSYEIDLSEYLPDQVVIGFSASTGGSVELHQVLFWEFTSSLEPRGIFFWIILSSLIFALLLVCVGIIWVVLRRKRKIKQARRRIDGGEEGSFLQEEDDFNMDYDELSGEFENQTGPKRYHFGELAVATKYFTEAGKLGQGGFGAVYKGYLKDIKLDVAIKRVAKGSQQGRKEYISEVKIISQLRHRNLVRLVGWCHERNDFLLVYELMPNGSLDTHLYGKGILLSWPVRYKIALGIASAILYLHEESENIVVHRDIKSSNVMLDSAFNAKLGDFGLAKLVGNDGISQTTVLAGTFGYLAPECITGGKASKESDVYSFGIVALEIACGRRPVEPKEDNNKLRLVPYIWELYGKNNLLEGADPKLNGEFDKFEMERLMVVGLWCAHPDFNLRPTMKQVLNVLQFEAPLTVLPPKYPMPVYLSGIGDLGLMSGIGELGFPTDLGRASSMLDKNDFGLSGTGRSDGSSSSSSKH
ncbi:hypothetical protein LUZ60_001455 [Juncus effusus]|nr:hypothetical protein LUZ60_001455 [Juncus effusus]